MRAALDLFGEQGYDKTTVIEIAQRAGLTKSTFFRHFRDKREVLFGRDELNRAIAAAISDTPAGPTPLTTVAAALDAASDHFRPERREAMHRRHTVIAGNEELRERELLKRATMSETIAEALRERGCAHRAARLAAELGTLAFHAAFDRWITAPDHPDFRDALRDEFAELPAALAALDTETLTREGS